MFRMLLLAALAALVMLFKHRIAIASRRRPSVPPERTGRMVKCSHCEVYVPESQSVTQAGLPYCSPEHAAAGPSGDAG